MKALSFITIFFILILASCCKEKECNPSCGPFQICNDGICSCQSDEFLLGNSCIKRCTECFEGSFTCGCTDKYVFDLSPFNLNPKQVTIHYKINGTIAIANLMTDVKELSSTEFRFSIPRLCDISGNKSTHIEFTLDTSDSPNIKVDARYLILPTNETLTTCSTTFTK